MSQNDLSGKPVSRIQHSSVGDSHASPTALQENVKLLAMSVISGRNCGELFAKLNPDGFWVKTSQDSVHVRMDGSLVEFCETWPRWGMSLGGVVGKLPMSEPHTTENGSSLLPTILGASTNPAAHGQSNGTFKQEINRRLATLPTPNARDYKDTGVNTDYRKLAGKSKLAGKIAMLPTVTTPRPHDTEKTAGVYTESQNQKDLTYALGKNHGLKLQSAFAEWMQGFPIGWTDLED